MEIKQKDDELAYLDPASDDESILVGMMFEKVTELFPDWPMGNRTDLAMSMLAVVKQWGHDLDLTSESHEIVQLTE